MSVKVTQSEYDKREYKYFVLPNQMAVLLVSDKEADKSGAAVDVRIGNLQDYSESPGLAHFLEHMLFLGTEKYPNQDEYRTFLSQNSGNSNAYTSATNTNYHFEVANSGFRQGLDIFAQFFLSPRFTETLTERELKAVDSEHKKNLNNDPRRRYQLMRSTSKDGQPFNGFGTGSLETLAKPNTREYLLKFYNQFYSANLMKCVLYGKEDIATLESWAKELFSGVRAIEGATRPEFKGITPFDKSNLSNLWEVVPINDKDFLNFFWLIENMTPHYRSDPTKYVTHLLGHEGPNSLLSLLIREGLAREMSAGSSTQMELFSYIEVKIELTKKGLERYLDVVNYVFAYLAMLKQHQPQQWIFDELKQIKKLRFLFKDKSTAVNEATSLADSLNEYPPEDVLIANYLLEEFKPDQIKGIINSLTLDNLRVFIYSKNFEGKTTQEEKW